MSREGLRPEGAALGVQEYGIAVLEVRVGLAEGRWTGGRDGAAREFSDSVTALCDDAEVVGALRAAAASASTELLGAAERAGLRLSPAGAGLVHRRGREVPNGEPAVLWFHPLLVVDNRDGGLGAVGTPEWGRALNESGAFPVVGRFYDHFLSFRCVRATPFLTREVTAAVVFGWGTSAVFVAPPTAPGPLDEELPVGEVMMTLQAFSSGLVRLNGDLLHEATRHARPRRWLTPRQYRRKLAQIDQHRVRAEMFLALLDEQRYAQSRREQVLWDGAVEAWELGGLMQNIRRNGDLLRNVYQQQRDLLDDRVKRRVSLGVSLVTLLSAAGVAFAMADSLLAGPDWGRAAVQAVIVAALLAVSVVLLRWPQAPDPPAEAG